MPICGTPPPAYQMLGKKELGRPSDYLADKRSGAKTLIGGELAWTGRSKQGR